MDAGTCNNWWATFIDTLLLPVTTGMCPFKTRHLRTSDKQEERSRLNPLVTIVRTEKMEVGIGQDIPERRKCHTVAAAAHTNFNNV